MFMQPFNHQDRRKAFLFFLLFFTITTVVVGATVFMSVQVPFEQNKQLNKEKQKFENEKDFQEQFAREMYIAKNLLDSLKRKDVDVVSLDGKIIQRIQSMEASIPDTLSGKDFFHDMVLNFSDLHSAVKEVKEANNQDENQEKLKDKIEELKSDLQSTKLDLKLCRAGLTQKD